MNNSSILEFIADIVLDVIKKKAKEKIKKSKLKKCIKEYIVKKQEANEYCSLKEEIDFE